jgi:glutamyl-tRNA synthetase
MNTSVRVRFAPSPTGMLHIGGLRTALYNYLFAQHHKGTFILRIEDTDQTRYVAGAEDDIRTSLKWAGLHYSEGPDVGGQHGPYRQSERSELYLTYATQLIANGHAYYAFDSAEEIEAMRERLSTAGVAQPKYDALTRQSMKNSLTLTSEEVTTRLNSGEAYVVRLKVPENQQVIFDDLIRGTVSFHTSELDDQVLLKSDGLPTYHLANVVDDHTMAISHVIRGEEWLSSAPKHILLYRAFGWDAPQMAHLPLIMSPAGGKLSKRNAEALGIPVNVRDYVSGRYEPDALINFLAFLGWNPGDEREMMSLDELVEAFSLEKVSKSGAVFNFDKLMWYNAHYLRARSDEDLLPAVRAEADAAGFSDCSDTFLLGVIRLMKERVARIPEFLQAGRFFFEAPSEYEEKTAAKAWKGDASELVEAYRLAISELADYSAEALKSALSDLVESRGLGFGKLMLPVRLAVSGTGGGPDLFETLALLGPTEVDARLVAARAKLG